MKKSLGKNVAIVVVGLLIIILPRFFSIDWAHGKVILYAYLAVCLGIATLEAKHDKKLTKISITIIIAVYAYIAYMMYTSFASYPMGII